MKCFCFGIIALMVGLTLLSPCLADESNGAIIETDYLPGIYLLKDTPVQLRKKDLKIKILSDVLNIDVKGKYTLYSTTPETLQFGLPMPWLTCPTDYDCDDPSQFTKLADKKRKQCRVKVNGKKVSCSLQLHSHNLKKAPVPWCVGEMNIPANQEVSVTFSYRPQFTYEFLRDMGLINVEDGEARKLKYPLQIGGHWGSSIGEVNIQLIPGDLTDMFSVHHPAGKEEGKSIYWTFKNVGRSEEDAIYLEIENEKFLKFLDVAFWNRVHQLGLKAVASSEWVSPGYLVHSARNAIDGRIETAWCEGVMGLGKEEWIQIHLRENGQGERIKHCQLVGIGLLPGFVRDAMTYKARGKISELEIINCLDPRLGYQRVKIEPAKKHINSVVMVKLAVSPDAPQVKPEDEAKANCYKIKIKKSVKGKGGKNSCITEIAPLLECN